MYIESFSGTGNYEKSFTNPMRTFAIINDDGSNSLTFTINGQTFTVNVFEEFTDNFPTFYGVVITATGAWRAYAEGIDSENTTGVGSLLTELRYELKDMDQTKYTNYELMVVLNTVISILNNFLAKEQNLRIFSTKCDLTLTDGTVSLPSDFMRIISLESNNEPGDLNGSNVVQYRLDSTDYYILGNMLYADGYSTLTLKYNYYLGRVESATDILPFPPYFNELIKKYMRMLILNDSKDIVPVVANDLYKLCLGREYVGYERALPFSL